jgi:hypothetical protein
LAEQRIAESFSERNRARDSPRLSAKAPMIAGRVGPLGVQEPNHDQPDGEAGQHHPQQRTASPLLRSLRIKVSGESSLRDWIHEDSNGLPHTLP